jgi:hypothetical protein
LLAISLLTISPAVAAPRLIYTKSFPGSVPAFIEIAVARSGDGVYKEDPKDEDPLKFQLSSADTDQIFHLADSLGHFSQPLEAKAKVANMGMKTFRYEEGAEGAGTDVKFSEVKFNFSENPDAQALADWFERMAETERAYIELERAVRFDKLGVQDAILRIEIVRDQKRLTAPQQFLPLLDRVAKNESFLHIARDRAGELADQIRAAK